MTLIPTLTGNQDCALITPCNPLTTSLTCTCGGNITSSWKAQFSSFKLPCHVNFYSSVLFDDVLAMWYTCFQLFPRSIFWSLDTNGPFSKISTPFKYAHFTFIMRTGAVDFYSVCVSRWTNSKIHCILILQPFPTPWQPTFWKPAAFIESLGCWELTCTVAWNQDLKWNE